MAIVTLTRQAGSFGDEIGMLIARRLGYTFYDKYEIEKRIIAKGLPKEEFLKYDERKPSFLARFAKNRDKYLNYLSSVILEIAKEGNCVIMGRGAFLFLKDLPNHITLRFVAPMEDRVKHLIELKKVESEKIARQRLIKSEKQKRSFYKSCFDYDIDDFKMIHASINTSLAHPDMTAEMIVAGIKNNITPQIEEAGKKRVEELVLAQEMTDKLIFEHALHIDALRIDVHDKVVTLQGVTSFHATVERAQTILESEYTGCKVESKIKCVQDNRFSKA